MWYTTVHNNNVLNALIDSLDTTADFRNHTAFDCAVFIEILRRLRPDIVVERFAGEAPPRYHHTEGWGLVRNETLLSMLDEKLEQLGVHQGDFFNTFAAEIK